MSQDSPSTPLLLLRQRTLAAELQDHRVKSFVSLEQMRMMKEERNQLFDLFSICSLRICAPVGLPFPCPFIPVLHPLHPLFSESYDSVARMQSSFRWSHEGTNTFFLRPLSPRTRSLADAMARDRKRASHPPATHSHLLPLPFLSPSPSQHQQQ